MPSPTVSEETRRLWQELAALMELSEIFAKIEREENHDPRRLER
jgi:hypothetical protein